MYNMKAGLVVFVFRYMFHRNLFHGYIANKDHVYLFRTTIIFLKIDPFCQGNIRI